MHFPRRSAGIEFQGQDETDAELRRVLELADLKEKLLVAGFEARTSMPEWFGDFIMAEAAKWATVVKEAGIRTE